MVAQILQIQNGFLLFESIEDLGNSIYFPTRKALVDKLNELLPEVGE